MRKSVILFIQVVLCIFDIHRIIKITLMEAVGKLTNLQIELLKLFQYNLPENQLAEIKNMLAKYFANSATTEMDKLWEENKWDNETMKAWASEHLRKK